MIKYTDKSVFGIGVNSIVNTVNCVGYAGAGIALECSCRFPNMYEQYCIDCANKKVKIGEILAYKDNGYTILNFPTKVDYKNYSQIEYIEKGLDYFVNNYKKFNLTEIAFPLLGCKNGKLDFETQVKPIMESKLKTLDIDIIICKGTIQDTQSLEMLEQLRIIDKDLLFNELHLTIEQIYLLKKELYSIERFDEIMNKKFCIKLEDYKKIYNYILSKISKR